MKLKLLISLGVFSVAGLANANCPEDLNAEMMSECMTIERSGVNYQDHLNSSNPTGTSEKASSTISPITGADVRTMQPASGTEKPEAPNSLTQ
jgi:hypothetical protein